MWFKTDDQFHDHRKVRRILDVGDLAALAALGVWVLSGSWVGGNKTNGFVPERVVNRWTLSKRITVKLASRLVDGGLWEPAEHDGERGWIFHDWADVQPTREQADIPVERWRWRRGKSLLRDRDLCERIVARDRCKCRYCGVRVNFADKRGKAGGTYDHVDPDGENTLENVVVACRRCNGRKGVRTPSEAGMTLLPIPGPDLAPAESDPNRDSDSDSASRARRPRGGTGQVGSESGPGRAGSNRAGSAPGPGPGPEPPTDAFHEDDAA